MNFQKIVAPVIGVVLIAGAYRGFGWPGVALVVGGIVMWVLLHVNRMMQALTRTAGRPVGWVDSAVMLNAKLKPGVNLLHVLALTRALGQLMSPEGEQPEIFRWTDGSDSHVTCEFKDGRLVKWTLVRPDPAAADVDAASAAPPAASTGS